jgi:hypothetical protein
MSGFYLYLLGFIVLLAGAAYGATLLSVPDSWILVGALILGGLSIMGAVTKTTKR